MTTGPHCTLYFYTAGPDACEDERFELGPMYTTDVRQKHRLMPPPYGGKEEEEEDFA